MHCSYYEYSQYQKNSQYVQYTRSVKYTSIICAPCDNSRPIALKIAFINCFEDTIHRWSHKWELKQITFGGSNWSTYCRILAVFRDNVLRVLAVFRGSVLRVLPVLQVFRGSILRLLPVLGVHGLPMGYSWAAHEQPTGCPWASHWTAHGLPVGQSMGCP